MQQRCRILILAFLLAMALHPAPAMAGYQYGFESYKADMQDHVNTVAKKGWEAFDIAFSPTTGFLVCYRKAVAPQKTPIYRYAFDTANAANAEQKCNTATKNGWHLFKILGIQSGLYVLCFNNSGSETYKFESIAGQDLEKRVNAVSQSGWDMVDLGYAGRTGWLVAFRRTAGGRPGPQYGFGVARTAQQALPTANDGIQKGYALITMVPAAELGYVMAFRHDPSLHYTYAFETAGAPNIESKADQAVKDGWEVYGVTSQGAGGGDASDTAGLLQSSAFLSCYRK